MRRSLIAIAATAAATVAIPVNASAAERSGVAALGADATARMTVAVEVDRFRATRQGTQAVGTVTATLRGLGGMPQTVQQKVTLSQAGRGTCRILTLTLEQLDLTLLGLNVHLDEVNLRVTGERRGGVLGRLFCSLAGARVRAARAEAAERINARLRRSPMRALRLTVPVQAQASQAQSCLILELTLGPLHLDLLGLIIDLNRVHLTITAIRGGGVLGDLFCSLASRPLPV